MTRAALALALGLVAAPARGDDVARAADRYFAAENLYNGLYVGIGSTNAAIGTLLATRKDDGVRAAGYPVIAVGGVELVVGIVYLALTPGWRAEAFAQLGRPDGVARQRARLRGIEKGFLYYELTDGAAALTGLGLGLGGAFGHRDALAGAGAGLGAVAFAQLTMDLVTHEVASRYLHALEHVRPATAAPLGLAFDF